MAGNEVDRNLKVTEEYWSRDAAELLEGLESGSNGLGSGDAAERLRRDGPNALRPHRRLSALRAFLSQFKGPLILILLFAAVISILVGEWIDATIVLLIGLASATLGFLHEYSASRAVEDLKATVSIKAAILRDGKSTLVRVEEIVPGDVVLLSAGSLIPADGIVLSSDDFFVNQAVLTGETFPVEKRPGTVAAGAVLAERTNTVFMGTNVSSGSARALILRTGMGTSFGEIADRLESRPEETEFERGVWKFGYLLTQVVMLLVMMVFIVNLFLHKPVVDSLLFAIALAVGVAPELLPAIINVTLSKGARTMAKSGVIVRKLNAIENLGSMDILCTDKTGTITEGVVKLDGALDLAGNPSEEILRWAVLNAAFQTGIDNPLDQAILAMPHPDVSGMYKLEEIPYDFIRKRLSVVIDTDPGTEIRPMLITKGALGTVLGICTRVRDGEEDRPLDKGYREAIDGKFREWSAQGYRVLGLALRETTRREAYTVEEDEREMTFAGFLLFFDPPKEDARKTIAELAEAGVQVKIITGDNRLVAGHIARAVGLPGEGILPAERLKDLSDEALWNVAQTASIFAEVDPNQKERIIRALRKTGHVVGYMGDGINDAPAMHAADVGISVEEAVDVAKEAAEFILLRRDLGLILTGIREGRRTFANTLKYIFTTTSANFGNMLSMAGASVFLPFLPLLAKQILLNNFLSDIPAIGIPGDRVDREMIEKPHRWNIRMIRNFMVVFGLTSSLFDYATFGLLLFVAKATEAQFQTGWFVESLLTELVIALVVRTRRAFFRSRPGRLLWILTLVVAVVALLVPVLPINGFMGFVPLPWWLLASLVLMTGLYVLAVEAVKKVFFRHHDW